MNELPSRQREILSASLDRLGSSVPIISLLAGAAVIAVYVQMRAWQLFAMAVLLLVNGLAFFLAGSLARHGLEQRGGMLMVATVWAAFTGAALLAGGISRALGVAAALVAMLLTVLVVAPRGRPWFWMGSLAVGVAIWALGLASLPWTRFDVATSPVTWLGVRLLLGSTIVVLVAQGVRAYRRTTLIPVRLTVLAVALVLATAAAVSGISVLMGMYGARQQAYAHLETDVVLKQEAIGAWADRGYAILDTLIALDDDVGRFAGTLSVGGVAQVDPEAAGQLRDKLDLVLQRTQAFEEIALADPHGVVMLSTDRAREGTSVEGRFALGEGPDRPTMASAGYDVVSGEGAIFLVRPLVQGDVTLGTLLGRADLTSLQQIAQSGAGEMSLATHLVGTDFALLTEPLRSEGRSAVHSEAIDAVVQGHASQTTGASQTTPMPQTAPSSQTAFAARAASAAQVASMSQAAGAPGRAAYTSHSGAPVLGAYVWVPDLQIGLVSEVPTAEVEAGRRATTLVNTVVAVVAASIAGAMAFAAAQDVAQPLSLLSDATMSIADGDLDQLVEVAYDDEVGALAESFNVMSMQLQDTIGDLERRLQARTRALEAMTGISEAVTSIPEPEDLLQRVVDLIRERFGLAYVGLFLLDEERRYAVLRAGTGEAGVTMPAGGWRLPAGGASTIGQCIATGEPVTMQRAGDARVRPENPPFPNLRSEVAIPIRYGARVLGAITVRSKQYAAFSDADLSVLQALADQVAVALQITLLADQDRETQCGRVSESTTALGRDYGANVTGYDRRGMLVEPLGQTLLPEVVDGLVWREPTVEGDTLRIPLIQGDNVLGMLGVVRPGGWHPENVALVTALAEELRRAAGVRSYPGTACDAAEPKARVS